MAGHSKWSQIKRAKGAADVARSRLFGKITRLIAVESKKCKGNANSPALRAAIEKAKKENVPKDTIERAVKKGLGSEAVSMEFLLYEAYGAGGAALIIEVLTDNRNKTAAEIKHVLGRYGASLGAQGSVIWAFEKTKDGYSAKNEVPLSKEDSLELMKLMEELEENDDVQEVYSNAQLITQ